MRITLALTASALTLAAALPALAQGDPAQAPASSEPAGAASAPAAGQSASTTAPAATTLTLGQPVKDKTGAVIGEIADLKPDGAGGQIATVKMGEKSFAIGAQSFVVQDGAALINATQAELKAMIANASKGG
jgi:hypothetical protein